MDRSLTRKTATCRHRHTAKRQPVALDDKRRRDQAQSARLDIKRPVLLFAMAMVALLNQASADEFDHVDPELLAHGVEKLAHAWTIPMATFVGATDDFAHDQLFEVPSAPESNAALEVLGPEAHGLPEPALVGLFTKGEIGFVIGEIDRRRRASD